MSKAEKFIEDYTRNCSNEIIGGGWNNGEFVPLYHPWLTPDQARSAVEIAREEMMEKVCCFLDGYAFIPTYVINELKQAMKDE